MKIPFTLLSCFFAAACAPTFAQTTISSAGVETSASPATVQTVSVSQVRIVRLSQVDGQVELDRKAGQTFDQAFMNLPIVAGAALRTKQGLAEVEFEDNSSLRLTPQSQVEFPRLGRDVSGSTITAIKLLHGGLYVSLAGGKSAGEFTVTAGNQTIVLTPSTHLRLDLAAPVATPDPANGPAAKLTVFQGSATVTGPSGSIVVTKRKAITFDAASAAAPEFVGFDGAKSAYDTWDKNAVDYHKVRTAAVASGFAGSPYSYGVNDLSYYGSFSDVGGCGTMWRPYMANAAFDPYSSGVWSWYPGQGYSWVSLYPWGWAPFHYGSWDYCPAGGGWGWNPQGGGGWRGVLNGPVTPVTGPGHRIPRPTPPPPPVRGAATMVAVNVKSLTVSHQDSAGNFVFRAGSAGLGVPRGVFSNLSKISQNVETHGTATTGVSMHQAQVGMLAPSRSSMGSSSGSLSSSSGSRSSGASSSISRSSSLGSSSASAGHSSGAGSGGSSSGGSHH